MGDRLKIIDKRGGARIVFVKHEPLPGHPMDLSGTAWRLLMKGARDAYLREAAMHESRVGGANQTLPYHALSCHQVDKGLPLRLEPVLDRCGRRFKVDFRDSFTAVRCESATARVAPTPST